MKRIVLIALTGIMLSCACNNALEPVGPSNGNKPNGGGNNTPTPAATSDWSALADSCTNVLVANFLDKSTGTFWSTPNDVARSSQYIYWQQAHALDVLLYAAEVSGDIKRGVRQVHLAAPAGVQRWNGIALDQSS